MGIKRPQIMTDQNGHPTPILDKSFMDGPRGTIAYRPLERSLGLLDALLISIALVLAAANAFVRLDDHSSHYDRAAFWMSVAAFSYSTRAKLRTQVVMTNDGGRS